VTEPALDPQTRSLPAAITRTWAPRSRVTSGLRGGRRWPRARDRGGSRSRAPWLPISWLRWLPISRRWLPVSWPHWITCAGWIRIRPLSAQRLRGQVAHDPAARCLRLRAPLKGWLGTVVVVHEPRLAGSPGPGRIADWGARASVAGAGCLHSPIWLELGPWAMASELPMRQYLTILYTYQKGGGLCQSVVGIAAQAAPISNMEVSNDR
jgi:hypothetical protein